MSEPKENSSGIQFSDPKWQVRPVMFFDGDCTLCNYSVRFVLDHEQKSEFLFTSLQSEIGRAMLSFLNKPANDFDSVVVWKAGKSYQKSDAVIEIASHLRWPFCLLSFLKIVPRILRDPCYSLVAKNRYTLFRSQKDCLLMTEELKARFLTHSYIQ
jgi:predicted DCC family thiol-disulfide oxidoreductase YuxK